MIFKGKNYAKINESDNIFVNVDDIVSIRIFDKYYDQKQNKYVDKHVIVFGLSNGQYEHSQAFDTKEQCFEFMTKYVFPGAVI